MRFKYYQYCHCEASARPVRKGSRSNLVAKQSDEVASLHVPARNPLAMTWFYPTDSRHVPFLKLFQPSIR
ncbi:MAG: hypothetical protein ACTHNW_18005 [Mucilaginibacter sp.]